MDDGFTLLRRAVGLLPEDATAENGRTVGDVRADLGRQDWERALDGLIEIGDAHPASPAPQHFWELLAEAARQMMLDRSSRWCRWRGGEVQHGTIRATLTLSAPEQGGRRSAIPGDGRLRPLWDIGHRTAGGDRSLDTAALWVEFADELDPGDTADVRLAPLSPDQWSHLKPGDVITLHEARPASGTATITEVVPPRT